MYLGSVKLASGLMNQPTVQRTVAEAAGLVRRLASQAVDHLKQVHPAYTATAGVLAAVHIATECAKRAWEQLCRDCQTAWHQTWLKLRGNWPRGRRRGERKNKWILLDDEDSMCAALSQTLPMLGLLCEDLQAACRGEPFHMSHVRCYKHRRLLSRAFWALGLTGLTVASGWERAQESNLQAMVNVAVVGAVSVGMWLWVDKASQGWCRELRRESGGVQNKVMKPAHILGKEGFVQHGDRS
jgi:hypothetical protein